MLNTLWPDGAARQSLMLVPAGAGAGVRAMASALERLNEELAHDLPEPLRIAIGLHVGPLILGEMGYRRATSLTAVGDTVNVAACLEALAKELDVELATSTRLAERAATDRPSTPAFARLLGLGRGMARPAS